MVLKVSHSNNIKVYHVSGSGQGSLPDWLIKKKSSALKYDPEWRQRVELIQDFEFPEASIRIKQTKDKKHIFATGVYKPQIRLYDLKELSLKFERHCDSENVQFEILSEDWTKTVFLQTDRTIEFHNQGGLHFKTRIPKFGRDLKFDYSSGDLLIVGSTHEIYRLNLDIGRFNSSLETQLESVNVVRINPYHGLYAFGGEDGIVEFWDPRSKECIAKNFLLNGGDVTSLEFLNDGLSYLVGTQKGQCKLFDLRKKEHIIQKDHPYGMPIINISYSEEKNVFITSDKKSARLWDKNTCENIVTIEPPYDINDVLVEDGSGIIMMANEGIELQTYYIPHLGPASPWCSFLENVTEEMEENPQPSLYDNYKFITRKEAKLLGLDQLKSDNSSILKPYMHGFFIDQRLYEKVKVLFDPFIYEDYKKNKLRVDLENEATDRVQITKKDEKSSKKVDERFKDLLENPDFKIDEESVEYGLLHPQKRVQKERDLEKIENNEQFNKYAAEEESIRSLSDDSESSDPEYARKTRKDKKDIDYKKTRKQKVVKAIQGPTLKGNKSSKLSFQERMALQNESSGDKPKFKHTGSMQVVFKQKSDNFTPQRRNTFKRKK